MIEGTMPLSGSTSAKRSRLAMVAVGPPSVTSSWSTRLPTMSGRSFREKNPLGPRSG
jgi:hypothetical protein